MFPSRLEGAELVRALNNFRVDDFDEDVLSAIVCSHVFELFLDAPTNEVLIAACRLVREAADRSENCRRALVDAGGVGIVYEALKQRAEDDAALFQATLGALGGLSSYGGHQKDRDFVSLPLLIRLLKKHPSARSSMDGLFLLAEVKEKLLSEDNTGDEWFYSLPPSF